MKNFIKLVSLLFIGATMTSCLDDKLSLDPANSTNVVEFKNPSSFSSPYGSKYALYTQAFEVAPENNYTLTVSYSGANVAPENITVSLGIDPTALTQYNTEQKKAFDLIPTSLYTLPTQVVIPKGQRTATVGMTFKSNNFDFSKNYVLPVQIKSVSTGAISGNFGTILINLKAKNPYDGVYTATGVFNHPTAGPRDIKRAKTLATVDANTSETEFADLGAAATMQLKVNADNSVTLTPGGTASAATVQFGVNKYDAATKTFTLSYKYAGAGGDRIITETIKKN
ncbi:BT_3987 domain-containing protein [Fibrella forsythiae]|uniref:DUF1735 domain-containing protein n=1 Tax=Fibrella forsythiae TaxID=2817061 RepID=A0ABS3JPX3_9BACT|nr:DUF1735 domain-containing protein [Fibrella forsythiae]MBO0952043.1 DUF1735 domain-containing protein [Fibrella forsythiae]